MSVGVKGMDYPDLIARTADGDIVAFLEQVFRTGIPVSEQAVLRRSIHHREENHIALITLKLSGIATEKPVPGENIWAAGDAAEYFR